MDPADSALTECLEGTARIQAILDRISTAPDLKSKLVMINVAEAIMERDPRLLQLPDSPAIVDAFTRIKEMLQAQGLSSQEMASSTHQSQQPHNQSSPLLPPEPECVRVGSLRFAAASPPLSSPVSTPSSQSRHTPVTVQREEAPHTIDLDDDERQSIFCALLEEELRWKPWLIPEHEHSFRGTRLALGGPRSYQGLPPIAQPSATSKKKRRARHRHSVSQTQVSDYILAPHVFSQEVVEFDTTFPVNEPGYKRTVCPGNASPQAQLSCCGTAIQAGLEPETEVQLVQPISVSAGGPGEPVQPHASSAGGSEEPSQLHASSAGGSGEPGQLHASSAGGPEEPVQPHATSAGGPEEPVQPSSASPPVAAAPPPAAPVPPPAGPSPAALLLTASTPQPEDDASPGARPATTCGCLTVTWFCLYYARTSSGLCFAWSSFSLCFRFAWTGSSLCFAWSSFSLSFCFAWTSLSLGFRFACSPGPPSSGPASASVPASPPGPASASASASPPGPASASASASPGPASASASASPGSPSSGPASASVPASPPGPASALASASPSPGPALASVFVSASPGPAAVLPPPMPRFAPRNRQPLSGPSAGLRCHRGRPPELMNCDLLCSRPPGRPPEPLTFDLLCSRPPGRPPELMDFGLLVRWPPGRPPELLSFLLFCCRPPGRPPGPLRRSLLFCRVHGRPPEAGSRALVPLLFLACVLLVLCFWFCFQPSFLVPLRPPWF
ncbi:proline-rich protein 36-like [Simochromis diagramma]|uniref:proline-rich protein 36-like n=1 Tax=Simochromis diagramma TaxID=43689 RepID=UPI001A7E8A4A|nr:proline-rich protein 36-like [Simochromis diagramma]